MCDGMSDVGNLFKPKCERNGIVVWSIECVCLRHSFAIVSSDAHKHSNGKQHFPIQLKEDSLFSAFNLSINLIRKFRSVTLIYGMWEFSRVQNSLDVRKKNKWTGAMTETGVTSPWIEKWNACVALKSLFKVCLVCKSWNKLWDKTKNAAYNRYIVSTCISKSSSKSNCLWFFMFRPTQNKQILNMQTLFDFQHYFHWLLKSLKLKKINYNIFNLIAIWFRSACAYATRKESELCALSAFSLYFLCGNVYFHITN